MFFRTGENVPEIYVNKSRDFQLLCRLKDVVFGGVKYNIDSLTHVSNTMEMNSSLLPLLKSKIGFFDYEELSEDQLRYLLKGFPSIIKNKGSKKSIENAIYLWLRLNKLSGQISKILIDNKNYEIAIYMDSEPWDTEILTKILNYILPTGYFITYYFSSQNTIYQNYEFINSFKGINIHNEDNSIVRSGSESWESIDDDLEPLVATVGLTRIIDSSDFKDSEGNPITSTSPENIPEESINE